MTAAKVISWRQRLDAKPYDNPGTPRVRMNNLWTIIFKHVKHIWGETRAFYLMCTRLQSNWVFWNGNGKKKQRTQLEDTGPRNLQSQWQPSQTFDLRLQTVCCGNFNNIVFPHVCRIAVLPMFLRNSEHGNLLNKQVLIGIFEVQCYNETSNVIIFTFKNQYISILRWVLRKPED